MNACFGYSDFEARTDGHIHVEVIITMGIKEKAEKTQKDAAAAIAAAYERNKGFESFIKLLPQSKNVGDKNNPCYVQIEVPYITVDGRVSMIVEEHVKNKQKFTISPPEFVVAPDSKTLLCRVTIESTRGTASGTAKIGINGSGVDSTNPYENAETSAIGHALGFLGYGLLGNGIASFDEVNSALAEKATQGNAAQAAASNTVVEDKPKEKAPAASNAAAPLTAREIFALKMRLSKALGPEATSKIMPNIKTRADVDNTIAQYGLAA